MGRFPGEFGNMAMGNLDGITRFRCHGFDAKPGYMGIRRRGEDEPVSEPVKKVGPQHARLNPVKCPLHSHGRPVIHLQHRPFTKFFVNPGHMFLPYCIPKGKKILYFPSLAPDQLISSALPAPDTPAAIKIVNLQLALIMAVAIRAACLFRKFHPVVCGALEPPKCAAFLLFALHFLLNTYGRAIRPQHFPVLRDRKSPAQHIFKGSHHTLVQGRAP